MRGLIGRIGWTAILATGLAACGGGDPDLISLSPSGQGPDEFAVVPNAPLQTPADLAALPVPTPGGPNLSDPAPEADAIAALGGNAAAGRGDGVRGPELIAQATRFGVEGDIRRTLAAEDLEFRRTNRGLLLERVFNVTTYFQVYRPFALDQYAELKRFRRAGVRTPAAPPEGY